MYEYATTARLVLAALLAAAGCREAPPTDQSAPSTAAAPAPPLQPGRPGARLAEAADGTLCWTSPGATTLRCRRSDGLGSEVALPGPAGELVATASGLAVTVSEPGLVVLLDVGPGGPVERARITVPDGISRLAANAEGDTLVVAGAGQALAVDVKAARVRWSVAIGAAADAVAVVPGGAAGCPAGPCAVVGHLAAPAVTWLHGLDDETPTLHLRPLPSAPGLLATQPLNLAGGVYVAATMAGATLPETAWWAWASDAYVPLVSPPVVPGTSAAWWFPYPARGTLVGIAAVAGGAVVSEVSVDMRPLARWPVPGCRTTRGAAATSDGTTVVLACADGPLRQVSLADGAVQPLPTRLTPPPEDCEAPPELAQIHLHRFADAEEVERFLRAARCRHPRHTRLVELGRSHQGRPILALVIGRDVHLGHGRPTLLLNGGHHGEEVMSTSFVLDAVATLLEQADERPRRWLDELVVVAVPLVNPDGNWVFLHERMAGRKNGRDTDGDGRRGPTDGVDCNRNYPFRWGSLGESSHASNKRHSRYYRGPAAGSEPETQAVMRLGHAEHPFASASFHTGALAVLVSYTLPGHDNPTPDVAWQVATQMAADVSPNHPEGIVPVLRRLYPVDGGDVDWLRATFGTLALLIEGTTNARHHVRLLPHFLGSVRSLWAHLPDRLLDGPALTGRVLDARGEPVEAVVSIEELAHHEGERWQTRCRDGAFARYLPGPGTYTLRVEALPLPPVVRRVFVGAERVDLDVVLAGSSAGSRRCATLTTPASGEARLLGPALLPR